MKFASQLSRNNHMPEMTNQIPPIIHRKDSQLIDWMNRSCLAEKHPARTSAELK